MNGRARLQSGNASGSSAQPQVRTGKGQASGGSKPTSTASPLQPNNGRTTPNPSPFREVLQGMFRSASQR
jgi:hypothetical protein